jgi:hypothetical protein
VGGALDGDRIVALAGIVMAMVLVSRSVRLRSLPVRQRWLLGAAWVAIFGLMAVLAELFLVPGSP